LRAFVVQRVPVLIAVNKTDMHTAHDSASIVALLEKEVEKRRIAARSKLADLTPGSAGGDAKHQLPDAAFKCVSARTRDSRNCHSESFSLFIFLSFEKYEYHELDFHSALLPRFGGPAGFRTRRFLSRTDAYPPSTGSCRRSLNF
jgi:hypothetical protein